MQFQLVSKIWHYFNINNSTLWFWGNQRRKSHKPASIFWFPLPLSFFPPGSLVCNKLVIQAHGIERNDLMLYVKVFYGHTADNRQVGGGQLCGIMLSMTDLCRQQTLCKSPSYTLSCSFTEVTLIQAVFDLALSCCSFSISFLFLLPGGHTRLLLTSTTPCLVL